jgi:hypothetical protein
MLNIFYSTNIYLVLRYYITVHFQTHESVPIDGLALIKFQIGQYIYPSYAYILENLAYDVALGALQLPPPTDTPPTTL